MSNPNRDKRNLTNYIEEELGAMLRSAREDLGLTRADVAEKLDVSEEDIANMETRQQEMALGLLQRYAELVNKKVHVRFFE